jgi:predicted Na+-dependent transporter
MSMTAKIITSSILIYLNFVMAQAVTSPVISNDENVTLVRQAIAFVLGAFTQVWAGVLFERTSPWRKYLAQVMLAGIVSAALIGWLRDGINQKLGIGAESGLAAFFGWVGAEGGFALFGRFFSKFFGSKMSPQKRGAKS